MFALRSLAAVLAIAPLAALAKIYTIKNQCPQSIPLYIKGVAHGSISAGGQTQKFFGGVWSGFIYTSANGGDSGGVGTTRAGFFGDNQDYYIVVDPNHFNTGVSISVNVPAHDGFCVTKTCNSVTCPDAFQQPPTRFPPKGPNAPSPPVYECPSAAFNYTVTFCPDGKFPTPAPAGAGPIHPNGNPSKCLDVRGAVYANGTPVQIYDCNGTGAQKWTIKKGNTQVRLAGTEFCLDAGSNPGNNVGMKIWKCYDNLPAQSWDYTDDKRITLVGKGQCLDLTNGKLTNRNRVQTYKCANRNTNQIWTR